MRGRNRIKSAAQYFPLHTARMAEPMRAEAVRQTKLAIADGRLVRQPCCVCSRDSAEAHHDDYSQPLTVIWLCRLHHRRRHAELRQIARVKAGLKPRGRHRTVSEPIPDLPPLSPLPVVAAKPKPIRPYRSRVMVGAGLVHEATVAIAEALDGQRVTDSELARRLGLSRQLVDASMKGGIRTLATLARFAEAADCEVRITVTPRALRLEKAS
jgi:hypothetical protein